jgi:predicted nuclease of restriction endonuclease-like (RecB) superfamily
MQIERKLHDRQGKALNNFNLTLLPGDSDMAAQIFKDPYLFDFLGTADPRREREVEKGLIDHIQRFLLELEKDLPLWEDRFTSNSQLRTITLTYYFII